MAKYLLKRIGQSIFTLVIILTLVFIMVRQMPIDGYFENIDKLDEAVIKATLDQMGLNDPILVQLKDFFVDLLHGAGQLVTTVASHRSESVTSQTL